LIGFSDSLQVIEMEIVSPPYLLDFGKAYFDCRAPYDGDQLAAWYEEMRELWDDDFDLVRSLVSVLWSRFRIHYLDVKPANVRFRADD
jgi:Ser/Thr protein kinase RdoA (MazF antagonist)